VCSATTDEVTTDTPSHTTTDRGRVAGAADRGSAAGAADAGPRPMAPDTLRVRAAVRLTELSAEHPLFSASGSTLSVLLHTDLMGTIQVAERDALPEQTAYAVYADLLAIHEGR
jgi:hypothetical protein